MQLWYFEYASQYFFMEEFENIKLRYLDKCDIGLHKTRKNLPGTSASNGKHKRSRPGGTALEKNVLV